MARHHDRTSCSSADFVTAYRAAGRAREADIVERIENMLGDQRDASRERTREDLARVTRTHETNSRSSTRSDNASSRRQTRGKSRPGASFPVPPSRTNLPKDYGKVLATIKARIRQERARVMLSANSAMVVMYWDIGRLILQRQGHAGWGAKVVDRLSTDLREAFPDMRGFSPRNLKYMRAFAAAWPDQAIVQSDLAQITWSHNVALLEKLSSADERLWYARETIKRAWLHPDLLRQIQRSAHRRQGKAQTNFQEALPAEESQLATQVFKDPYVFDFMGTADLRCERDIEQALVDHIQRFLLELGSGFAFVGRQVHLEVGDSDLYADLLFYHLKLRCYVVVELKAVPFEPAFLGTINTYLSAVDDLLRAPEDRPTIGLLLCRSKNRVIVEYALRGLTKPIGVADWETELVTELPEGLKGSLPTIEEIEAELERTHD